MSSNNSSNKLVVPGAREAMDKFKMEAANEVGVNLKQGYNGDLTSREAGSVGGQMVKNMIKSYFNDLEDLRYQVEYVDETEFLGTGGGLNVSFYSNTEVDDLLAKARVITDETQRGEYYKEVQTILSQDLPILPLVEYAGYYACPSYISGLPYIDTDVDDINAYNFSKVTINK